MTQSIHVPATPKRTRIPLAALALAAGLVLAITAAPHAARAQGQALETEPAAREVLDAMNDAFRKVPDLKATYRYTIRDRQTDEVVQDMTGTIRMKGDMYHLDLGDQAMYCDGKTVWDFRPQDQEVNVMAYDPEASLGIRQLVALYEETMVARLRSHNTPFQGAPHYLLQLVPKPDQDLPYYQVRMWVERATKLPSKLEVYMRSGSTVEYVLKDVKTNLNLQVADFRWDAAKYPGVEVVDFR